MELCSAAWLWRTVKFVCKISSDRIIYREETWVGNLDPISSVVNVHCSTGTLDEIGIHVWGISFNIILELCCHTPFMMSIHIICLRITVLIKGRRCIDTYLDLEIGYSSCRQYLIHRYRTNYCKDTNIIGVDKIVCGRSKSILDEYIIKADPIRRH